MTSTLQRQKSLLAEATYQLRILESCAPDGGESFSDRLREANQLPLRAAGIEVLQLNLGKVCNQTCAHCHVDAGPDRRESMARETAELCLRVLKSSGIPTL